MPGWVIALAWASLAIAFGSALFILYDILVGSYRQPMKVMEAVWPITALYFGPLAVLAYWAWGRPATPRWRSSRGETPSRPFWTSVMVDVSHCGAGCVLGDVISEFFVFFSGVAVAGSTMLAEYVGDYVAAVAFGIGFQYFAIAPMRGLGLRDGLREAAKADILSLSAFEIGLFGWMALMSHVFFPNNNLQPNSPVFWVFMQVGMIIGFITAYPANVWLIRRGIKEGM